MNTEVSIQFNKPFEFLYSLFALGTHDSFYDMIKSYNLVPNENIKAFIDTNKKTLSQYLQTEIDYFFKLSGLGYILYKLILENEELKEIPDFLNLVDSMPSDELALLMIRSFLKNSLSAEELTALSMAENHKNKIHELIEKVTFQDTERKEKILDVLNNPEEIKERFLLVLKQYYVKSFKLIENKLESKLLISKSKYEELYKKNARSFFSDYLNIKETSQYSNFVVHISFFKYVGVHQYSLDKTDSKDWFILGMYTELLQENKQSNEKTANFFKALSDANRIEIVKLLNQRPWFGQELAEKLNLAPATISYHMGFLQQAGLVTFIKSEKRSYFSLEKEEITNPLKDFLRLF